MLTATESLAKIQQAVEQIDKRKEQNFPNAATNNDYFRQGDLYIFIRDSIPRDCIEVKNPSLQLAPGTTQGSRHCLDSLKGVSIYQQANGDALQGPWLKITIPRIIKHPQHGDVKLITSICEIVYQRAFAEELKRVLD